MERFKALPEAFFDLECNGEKMSLVVNERKAKYSSSDRIKQTE